MQRQDVAIALRRDAVRGDLCRQYPADVIEQALLLCDVAFDLL
jgi:hypothetical protein